ncbi:MAG TPA: hypothetical protein VEG31_01565 [Thermoproteota archaeon]|nr:hypothetical protein [Thermoproteota archaeon]
MVEGMSRIYTWVIIMTDIFLSVILSFLVFWRGVVHPVLFVTAVILPVAALGYNRGFKEAKGANLVTGITLLSYFLTVNYYLIMLPSTQVQIADMVSIVTGTVLSILLVVLSIVCTPKKST